MAVEFPIPYELFLIMPAVFGAGLLAVRLGPGIVAARRQAAYEQVVAPEMARLEIAVPSNQRRDPDLPGTLLLQVFLCHQQALSGIGNVVHEEDLLALHVH